MRVLGLTGGVATGKSTAARYFIKRGVPVIDADTAAREIVKLGSPVLEQIVQRFGASCLTDGALNRAALRQIIFSDSAARRALEAITHPAIAEAIQQQLIALERAAQPAAIIDAALMVETGSYKRYKTLIVISCSPKRQLHRLMLRNTLSEQEALAIIRSQLPLSEKECLADVLIFNDQSVDALHQQIDRRWTDLFT